MVMMVSQFYGEGEGELERERERWINRIAARKDSSP